MANENLSTAEQNLINDLDWDRKSDKLVSIENPYSGQSCMLDARGVALHDFIKGAEELGERNWFNLALPLFAKLYPSQYYTLLD
jgi:hypothetical protein